MQTRVWMGKLLLDCTVFIHRLRGALLEAARFQASLDPPCSIRRSVSNGRAVVLCMVGLTHHLHEW